MSTTTTGTFAAAVALSLVSFGLGLTEPAQAGPDDRVIPAATFDDANGRIAFRRYLDDDRTWGALFTIRPGGTGERRVTRPPKGYVDRNPDVSPDGRRIVFQRQGVDCGQGCFSDEVWVVNTDGTGLQVLTQQPVPGANCDTGGYCDSAPAWSPDGSMIVFSRAFGPVRRGLIERAALWTMGADGSDPQRLTQDDLPATGEDSEPQWSPDGDQILFQRWNVRAARPRSGVALWILDLDTGRERRITPFRLRAGDTPDWSPDGRRILFHDNLEGPEGVSANLFTIRPDGTRLRQLTFAADGITQYLGSSYSPDGTKIAVGVRLPTGGTETGAADVFVMRVDGSHRRHVTRTGRYDSYPDWGPQR